MNCIIILNYPPANGESVCEERSGSLAPQLILFGAQLISGVGQTLFYSLGTTYMDDNVQKSKTASFISNVFVLFANSESIMLLTKPIHFQVFRISYVSAGQRLATRLLRKC